MAGFAEWRVGRLSQWLSFPLCGNGWSKPLDSSFRWNDGEGSRHTPARRASLRWNDSLLNEYR